MSITVYEALKLERLRGFRLIAGKSGLDNRIERVGILDWEFDFKIEGQFGKGEFVLSSFLCAKGDVAVFIEAVKWLYQWGVCGLAVKNIYYNEIPEEIVKFANENDFPVFIFDNSVFFDDIITDVVSAIRNRDSDQLFETKVDLIINKKISKAMIKELALEINSSFKENLIAAYCKEKRYIDDGSMIRLLEGIRGSALMKPDTAVFKYRSGILIIHSYAHKEDIKPHQQNIELVKQLGMTTVEYHIGMSDAHFHLDELDSAISECLYAERAAEIVMQDFMQYRDIGIYKVLMPHLDGKHTQDFCREILLPLKSYDEKNHTELLSTAIKYIACDGNVKKTSEALFQHDNTIRYRVGKMKEILGMEGLEGGFYEQLSAAVKIYLARQKGL